MNDLLDSTLATLSLELSPIGVLIINENGTISFSNKTFRTIFGIKNTPENIHSALFPATLKEVISSQKEEFTMYNKTTDTQHFYKCWHNESIDSNGNSIKYFLDVTKITQVYQERDRLENELSKVSTRDPQTGLPNKIALMQSLEPLVSRSRRYNNPLSLIRLYIQEKTDETHNLEKIMLTLAHFLKDKMRWADIVGRLTNHEFLLILPETEEQDAHTLARKLIEKINLLSTDHKHDPISYFSIKHGVSSWSKGDDTMRLINKTKRHLSQGKAA
ncbi:hypothetical protein MNBD_GAMMA16-1372 [hydrothermal vent metagenome]|uniref:GGDEF domain-containing protein n=1 Tax=hydrothermal vent metagenome TaxID=652676 RepID=A0A3B0Z933_9ZZZZ